MQNIRKNLFVLVCTLSFVSALYSNGSEIFKAIDSIEPDSFEQVKSLVDKDFTCIFAKDIKGRSTLGYIIEKIAYYKRHASAMFNPSYLVEKYEQIFRCLCDKLITEGIKIDECIDSDGWTPLIYAAYYANIKYVLVLEALGSDVNKKDENKKTVLYHAAMSCEKRSDVKECCILLINKGAKAKFSVYDLEDMYKYKGFESFRDLLYKNMGIFSWTKIEYLFRKCLDKLN